jgi:hypothetical protein
MCRARNVRGLALGMLLLWGHVTAAAAQTEKLAPEACRMLSEQVAEMDRNGAKALFARGADWARENATPAQLEAVGRYIALSEQLKFRCPVGFDNLVVAAINGDLPTAPPPLPERPSGDVLAMKKALSARRPAARSAETLPLPVRKPAQLRR